MSANNTQVAGQHYKAKFQHWDLVAQARLDYFEGQITKYVTRHRKKNGKQDLEKALHFAQKLVELRFDPAGRLPQPHRPGLPLQELHAYAKDNELIPLEAKIIHDVCSWFSVRDLQAVCGDIQRLMNVCYSPKDYGGEPCSGYVNQDR